MCEIMEQAGVGFDKPGQQQWLLFPEWKQDKMTISKKYAPLRPEGLTFNPVGRLVRFVSLAASFLSKGKVIFDFKKSQEVENII